MASTALLILSTLAAAAVVSATSMAASSDRESYGYLLPTKFEVAASCHAPADLGAFTPCLLSGAACPNH